MAQTQQDHAQQDPGLQDETPLGDSNFSDGSESLFSMYLEKAEKQDREMVESWRRDADGILVFVGLCVISRTFTYNAVIVDWVVLSCRWGPAHNVCPGHSPELAGNLGLLSCTHLSAALTIERNSSYCPLDPVRSHPAIFSTYMVRLGQRTLVLEPLYQSYLRPGGEHATTMGTSLSQARLPTAKPSQASTHSHILFWGSRVVARSMDGRIVTSAAPNIPFPLFRRPWGVLVQYPSHSLQGHHVVDLASRHRIHVYHVHADSVQDQPLRCAALCVCLFLSRGHAIWPRTLSQ